MSARPANDGSVLRRIYEPSTVWSLDLEGSVTGRTWWWWFWLIFLRGEPEGARPRQVMIMHSTRLADHLKVNGLDWRPAHKPKVDANGLRASFSGLSAAWYFDGKTMHHPLLLQSQEYTLSCGPEGSLTAAGRGDLDMRGDGSRYLVGAANNDGTVQMSFELTPWTGELSAHESAHARFFAGWNYSIVRVPALRAHGEIRGPGESVEEVEGTAYFQRLRVNGPTVPWYWGIIHADPGIYVDYFQANLGADLLRSSDKARPRLDAARGANLGRRTTLQVIDGPKRAIHEFRDFRIRPRLRVGAQWPDFVAAGKSQNASVQLALRPFERACWSVEQRGRWLPLRRRLRYNELPAELVDFNFEDRASGRRLALGDLSNVAAVCEHAWGALP